MNPGKPTTSTVATAFHPHNRNRLTALFTDADEPPPRAQTTTTTPLDSGPEGRQSVAVGKAQPAKGGPAEPTKSARQDQSPNGATHTPTTTLQPTPPTPTPIITPEITKSIESLDPETLTDLLTTFLFEGEPLRDLAARLNLSLTQLIAWHDHLRTQTMMDHLDRIANARAQRQQTQSMPAAIHALHLITQIHPANKPETTRKAATTLLKKAPAQVAPSQVASVKVAPVSDRCGHQPPDDTNTAFPSPNPKALPHTPAPEVAAPTNTTATSPHNTNTSNATPSVPRRSPPPTSVVRPATTPPKHNTPQTPHRRTRQNRRKATITDEKMAP